MNIKINNKLALKAFLSGKKCFCFITDGFGKSLVKHDGAFQLDKGR